MRQHDSVLSVAHRLGNAKAMHLKPNREPPILSVVWVMHETLHRLAIDVSIAIMPTVGR